VHAVLAARVAALLDEVARQLVRLGAARRRVQPQQRQLDLRVPRVAVQLVLGRPEDGVDQRDVLLDRLQQEVVVVVVLVRERGLDQVAGVVSLAIVL
jgi:hypothetical protein